MVEVVGWGRWGIEAADLSTAGGVETGVDGVAEDEEEGKREESDG